MSQRCAPASTCTTETVEDAVVLFASGAAMHTDEVAELVENGLIEVVDGFYMLTDLGDELVG